MKRTGAVIGIGVLAAGLVACGGTPRDGSPRSTASVAAPLRVEVLTVTRAPRAVGLEAGGVVAAVTSAAVSSRVMAPVLAVRVHAGDRVKAGQLLAVLEDTQLGAQARQAAGTAGAAEQALAAARSQETAAVADQRLADAWHRRISTLRAQDAATAQELDEADARLAGAASRLQAVRAGIAQAIAALDAARAGREAAETTQGFARVTAPFDGLVTETLIEVGNLATPGAPLVRLDADGAREIDLSVDEARIPYVKVGDTVAVLFDEAATPASMQGTVREVARAVASDTRAFTVKVGLQAGVTVRSGTFARVRFTGPSHDTLTIPASAVRRQGQLATVFVIDGEIARIRLVQTGRSGGDGVEVLAGLEPGDRIVAAPPAVLVEGTRVTGAGR